MRKSQRSDKFLDSELIDKLHTDYQVRTISEFFNGDEGQQENAAYAVKVLNSEEGLSYKEIAKRVKATVRQVIRLELSGW